MLFSHGIFRDRTDITELQSQCVEQNFVDIYRSTPSTLNRLE